eukprot:107743_1
MTKISGLSRLFFVMFSIGLVAAPGKIHKFPNGNTYQGEWRYDWRKLAWMMHGRGIFKSQNGYKYEGEFKDDKRHGNGKSVKKDGDVYDGEFVRGQKHGNGIYTKRNGYKYEGEF